MIVLCACNEIQPRFVDRLRAFCGRCGLAIEVLLTTEDNKERISRGVGLAEWFAAPKVPETRADCEQRNDSACPYLRCRNNLGAPGRYGCAIDVAEDAPTSDEPKVHHTLEHIGDHMNIGKERVRQIELVALHKYKANRKRLA